MCLTFVFINERFLKQPSPFLPSTLYYVSVCSPIGKYPNLLSLTQKKFLLTHETTPTLENRFFVKFGGKFSFTHGI